MASDWPFLFPVVTIGADKPGSRETFWVTDRADELPFAEPDLGPGDCAGMIVVDATGRQWTCSGARPAEPPRPGLFGALFGPKRRFVVDIAETSAMDLETLKARALAGLDADPDTWRLDWIEVGAHGAPPRDQGEMLDELKMAVRTSASAGAIGAAVLEVYARQDDTEAQDYLHLSSPSGTLAAVAATQPDHSIVPALTVVRIQAPGRPGKVVFAARRARALTMRWTGDDRLTIAAAFADEPDVRETVSIAGRRIAIDVEIETLGYRWS